MAFELDGQEDNEEDEEMEDDGDDGDAGGIGFFLRFKEARQIGRNNVKAP